MTLEPAFSRAWFDTFGRPDRADTEREVAFLLGVLPPPPASVLDVPCGFGRHALALGDRGYRVVGVERAPEVAREARAAGVDVRELDMRRLGELPETFDAVVCMWASFGWFDDATNAEVLAAMAARTRPGGVGVVVLDLYDPAFFRPRQGTLLNRGVRDTKAVHGNRLRTTLEYPDGERDEFEWRLYEPDELRELGAAAGLELTTLCAGFDPTSPPAGEVPRIQAVLHAPHAPR
jgi:SAM-dependent methyltransferase